MLLFIITDVADDDMEDGSETASDASEIYHLPHQLWTEKWSFESAELISKYYACKHSVQFISDKIKIFYYIENILRASVKGKSIQKIIFKKLILQLMKIMESTGKFWIN